jgi:molecular chaperone GrpE
MNMTTEDKPQEDAAAEPEREADAPEEGGTGEGCGCQDIDELRAKCEEYLAGWQRAQADYANLQKDVEKMRAELAKFAASELIEKLLPVLDGFAMAGSHTPRTEDDQVLKWCQGVTHIQVQLENTLSQAGLTIIDEADVPFDPEVHEAVLRRTEEGVQPDTVIEVVEQGYRLHDKLIRPAKVIVAE